MTRKGYLQIWLRSAEFGVSSLLTFALFLLVACASIPTSVGQPAKVEQRSLSDQATDMPLALHNTWVYQATRYDGVPITEIMTTTLVITDTVVETQTTSSFYIAKIHHEESAEIPVFVPQARQGESLRSATSNDYWLIVSENHVYREERRLDLSLPSGTSTLEFVLPLKLGARWYLVDELEKLNPGHDKYSMLRQVTRIGKVMVPAGSFDDCFFLEEGIGGGTFENWFCPGVGFVVKKNDHHGTPMGWHQVLVKYQIN